MRRTPIAPDEYYHIYNRGNHKQLIFIEEKDWIRFLFLIIHLQSPTNFSKINRQVSYFIKNHVFNTGPENRTNIEQHRSVELINFALMPNHFHLTVRELTEGGIATYMQRILCSHTKYFNTKYNKSGHLFRGPYKAVHVGDNNQLLYLSTYIHRNPRELSGWKNKEERYPWSSFYDYVIENRWDSLLKKDIVAGQFKSIGEYKSFVRTSKAKTLTEELDSELFID